MFLKYDTTMEEHMKIINLEKYDVSNYRSDQTRRDYVKCKYIILVKDCEEEL